MSSKAIIIFPYSGYENNKQCEYFFWWTVDKCKAVDPKPIVVLNKDTELNNNATSFMEDPRFETLEVIRAWAVDTCQMWLYGWGHVLDHHPQASRIVQIPGDIDYIDQENEFYRELKVFIESTNADIAMGDFKTGNKYSAKSLVDTYGTYTLLANWFPEISKSIRSLPLTSQQTQIRIYQY